MSNPLFGLWHNGWCHFQTSDHDSFGSFAGSKKEAEAGRAIFIREGNDPSEYEVMEFDHRKEPASINDTPSNAQLECLYYVAQFGTINRFPFFSVATTRVCRQKGWTMTNLLPDGKQDRHRPLKLTSVGLQKIVNGGSLDEKWYIDAEKGDDSNSGKLGSPLKTFAELERRLLKYVRDQNGNNQ